MAGPIRVSGGIFTKQNLSGSLRFFKMASGAGQFANAVSDGTIIVPGATTAGGNPLVTFQYTVPNGQPVPNSAAERAVRVLLEKATLVQASIIDTNNIHLVFENTSFGWDTPAAGDAAAEMEAAVQALGTIGLGANNSIDPPVPDNTVDGVDGGVDLSGVTVTEVDPFQLA